MGTWINLQEAHHKWKRKNHVKNVIFMSKHTLLIIPKCHMKSNHAHQPGLGKGSTRSSKLYNDKEKKEHCCVVQWILHSLILIVQSTTLNNFLLEKLCIEASTANIYSRQLQVKHARHGTPRAYNSGRRSCAKSTCAAFWQHARSPCTYRSWFCSKRNHWEHIRNAPLRPSRNDIREQLWHFMKLWHLQTTTQTSYYIQ